MNGAEIVNVLALGVKNDGSEDISTIVNEATVHSSLFFPKGIYKVEKPLYLKNSVRGDGYSRYRKNSNDHTWLISAIENTDSSVGIINIEEGHSINIENLTLQCNSGECGLRIDPCSQQNMLFIDRVGIFNVQSCGIYARGSCSRPLFLQNMTIWGAREYPVPGIGMHINTSDNRLDNIEIMGCRVGMHLHQLNYANNIHIWTGSLSGRDNGSWWRGTRSVVLEGGAMFHVSNFYPDTSFYAVESRSPACSCHISNLIYWEDGSTGGAPDFDGEFFKGPPGAVFRVNGGEIYTPYFGEKNGRMSSVYTPGNFISNVLLKTDAPICAENLHRLILDDTLPDYTAAYEECGFCKIAQIVTAQKTGFIKGEIICENGASYEMQCIRKENGPFETNFRALNALCEETPPLAVRQEKESVYTVYFRKKTPGQETFRFVTHTMQSRFRPLHFGSLRNLDKTSLCNEVISEL